ncbi:hypothetical protein ACI2K4_01235 [Micromonospora sp. NPDC050397]|uniref:hypothetical protein n=1 Tax=Micromonospora sp. NPDC050397 TaxID=3364279 RepID=UPI003851574E
MGTALAPVRRESVWPAPQRVAPVVEAEPPPGVPAAWEREGTMGDTGAGQRPEDAERDAVPVDYQETRPVPEDGAWPDEIKPDEVTEDDGSGVAGGSSGGSGGGSTMPGHPDATR